MPSNQELSSLLREIYQLMQLAGENRFRAIAFDRAAQTIENLDQPVNTFIKKRSLTDLSGIGKSIADDIYHFSETGQMPVLEELRDRVPRELLEWLNISGLGPKSILKIHQELGILSIDELREACLDGRVASLPGLGEKSAEKIVLSIDWLKKFGQRSLFSSAERVAESILEYLEKQEGVEKIQPAGSLRRKRETVGDVDLLVGAAAEHSEAIFDAFSDHEMVLEILGRGETKCSVRTVQGLQVDVRIVDPAEFPAALLYFTGSKEHNVRLRQRARTRRMALNEYGLFQLTSGGETDFSKPMEYQSEADIYRRLDLNFVPPELREDQGEIDYFEGHEWMPLVEESDIRGIIHAHSTWSDGKQTIEEMARACHARGYEYIGITDHSRTAAYAGGLTIEQIYQQWEEIDRLNERFKEEGLAFTIFKGVESDILVDGSLDYPDDLLAGFDFVIASVHSSLEMPSSQMTERFLKAIEHPATRMVGHPSGRLLLRRGTSELNMDVLIEAAAKHQTAIEINANPNRLDLDWRYGSKAKSEGLLTSINPDAHSVQEIDYISYGVNVARKGKFDRDRVLNTRTADEFRKWMEEAG